MKAVITKGQDGQFYFKLVARNNRTVAQSEGYKRKESVHRLVGAINMASATGIKLEDKTR